jgi:hypothetical protein
MAPSPVGMRCPECWGPGTLAIPDPPAQLSGLWSTPATFVLIAINLIVYLIEVAGSGINDPSTKIFENYALAGPFVAEGEWYRLVTAGFCTWICFASSFMQPASSSPAACWSRCSGPSASPSSTSPPSSLLRSERLCSTPMSSVFGLLATGVVLTRTRGSDSKEFATWFAALIAINLIGSFIAADATAGDYLGGVVGGLICAITIVAGDRGMLGSQPRSVELQLMAFFAAIVIFASIVIA